MIYLQLGDQRITFTARPEQNLGPRGHAEICKQALEQRGYEVDGPFDDADEEARP